MKDYLTDTWHIKMLTLPYGEIVIRVFEKSQEKWEEVSSRFYGWYDILARRDFEMLCRMAGRKEVVHDAEAV